MKKSKKRNRPTPSPEIGVIPEPPAPVRPALAEWAHWLIWLVAVFPVCWRQITTSDCWWHVALGRWLAERHRLPDYAQFYFTPINPRVTDLRWTAGGDLLLFFVHAAGGPIALQMLSFAAVALGCFLLRRLYAGPMNGWITALLALVAFGTYQLQLPRNALFSLPLTALIFFLFQRFRATRSWRTTWLLPLVVAIWSLLHASCLLGCVLVGLLFAVDALEGVRTSWREVARRAKLALVIGTATLAVVTVGNPAAVRVLRRPVDYVFKTEPAKRSPTKATAKPPQPVAAAPAPRNVKEWLNNLIWPVVPGQVRSADFSPSLDRLDYRPVAVAFGLMVLAAAWALWTTAPPLPSLVAYLAMGVLGLSYFRMTGYAALGSAALILSSGPLRGRVAAALAQSHWMGAALTVLAAVVLWSSWAFGSLARVIGNSRHVVATGKVATFDDAATDWLLEHHRDQGTFTTIVTGSYALHRWQGRKPVFIDGFFAPHTDGLWNDYVRGRRDDQGTLLREKYGIEFALIEHTRQDWNRVFLAQRDWQPAAIGLGCTIYGHTSALADVPPAVLFSAEEGGKLPPYFRSALARNYYGAILALLAADRTEAAKALVNETRQPYLQWRRWITPAERQAVRQMDPILRPRPNRGE